MTYLSLDLAGRIPDSWLKALRAEHKLHLVSTDPKSRHLPSLGAMRRVLSYLAIRVREPSLKHRRVEVPYTDETRGQIAHFTGQSEAVVGDVLALYERAGWIVVLVRGNKHRGSVRTLPILKAISTITGDLSGELPTELNPLLGENKNVLSGNNGLQSGMCVLLDGEFPASPIPSKIVSSVFAPAAALKGGSPLTNQDTEATSPESICHAIKASIGERGSETWQRGLAHIRSRNGAR